MLMAFGVIAMILTALGTYGLVSYAARQSTHEIGIRIAIGADRGETRSSGSSGAGCALGYRRSGCAGSWRAAAVYAAARRACSTASAPLMRASFTSVRWRS